MSGYVPKAVGLIGATRFRAMIVEDDVQADGAGIVEDQSHVITPVFPLQVGHALV